MDNPAQTDMLVMWQRAQCHECKRGMTQLAKLAQSNLTETTIAKVDCKLNEALCQVWLRDFKTTDQTKVEILLIRDRQVYKYPQDAIEQHSLAEWLSKPHTDRIADNLIAYVVEGERLFFE